MSPALTDVFLSNPSLLSVPFFLAGGLKIVYDLPLYRSFKATKPPEEAAKARRKSRVMCDAPQRCVAHESRFVE